MSVNLSPRQLEDGGLAAMVAGAIRAGELDPAAVCLEVAERDVTRRPEVAQHALEGLKTAGVAIAIDDYGTGAARPARPARRPRNVTPAARTPPLSRCGSAAARRACAEVA